MRKIFWFFIIIVPLIFLSILILKNKNTNPQKSSAATSASPTISTENTIKIGNFNYSWFEVDNTDNLKLIPNFDEKLSSSDVISKNSCKYLSNAGFYSKEEKPIGLFISEKNKVSDFQENSLFDGILSINDMATPRITRDVPQDSLRIAMQTGPILKDNSFFQNLKIQNDSPSRRLFAGVTGENRMFIVAVWDQSSEYLGPKLGDMPDIVKSFEKESGILFADAINLDGGSASTFYNSNTKLSELSNVGAFFCQL